MYGQSFGRTLFLRVFIILVLLSAASLTALGLIVEQRHRMQISAGVKDAVETLSLSLAQASAAGNTNALEMQMDRIGSTKGVAYAAFQDGAHVLRRSRRFPNELNAIPLDDPLRAALIPFEIATACDTLTVLPLDHSAANASHHARLAICTLREQGLVTTKLALTIASVVVLGALFLSLLTVIAVKRLIAGHLQDLHAIFTGSDDMRAQSEEHDHIDIDRIWRGLADAAMHQRAARAVFDRAFSDDRLALIITDHEHRILRASPALGEMLGELKDMDVNAAPRMPLAENILNAACRDGSVEFKTADGQVLELSTFGAAVAGRNVRRLMLLRHGSDAQREGVATTESRRIITRLSSGIAHDINNMLAAIQGNAELLLAAGTLDQADCSALMTIIEASQGGAMLTRDLLSFAGHQTLRPEALGIEAVIEDALRSTVPALPDHVNVIKAKELSGIVTADRFFLKTALSHLIFNASDAIKHAGQITLRSEELQRDGKNFIAIWIEDNGVGMTPDIIERACEPFFTTKRLGKGRGLGLAMANGFAAQSGGVLNIDSTPQIGTKICLILPAHTEESIPSPSTEKAEAKERSQSIVLIDPDKSRRDASLRLIEKLGHKAVSVPSPEGFLVVAPRILNETDAILCDASQSLETLRHMRSMAKEIPMILLAETGTEAQIRASAIARGRIVLAKPIDETALQEALTHLTNPMLSQERVFILPETATLEDTEDTEHMKRRGNGGG